MGNLCLQLANDEQVVNAKARPETNPRSSDLCHSVQRGTLRNSIYTRTTTSNGGRPAKLHHNCQRLALWVHHFGLLPTPTTKIRRLFGNLTAGNFHREKQDRGLPLTYSCTRRTLPGDIEEQRRRSELIRYVVIPPFGHDAELLPASSRTSKDNYRPGLGNRGCRNLMNVPKTTKWSPPLACYRN